MENDQLTPKLIRHVMDLLNIDEAELARRLELGPKQNLTRLLKGEHSPKASFIQRLLREESEGVRDPLA